MRKYLVKLLAASLLVSNLFGLQVKAAENEVPKFSGSHFIMETQEDVETLGVTYADSKMTIADIYSRMMAKKAEYPEGMRWTNDDLYMWDGGIYSGGYGCAGFAFILSDAAFGNLRARILDDKSFNSIRVGDILRVNNDTHSVIVLEVHDDYVVIAEGNYNSSIHWGRTLRRDSLENGTLTYIMTRYITDPPSANQVGTFTDVPNDKWYFNSVRFAYNNGIMTGKSADKFEPEANITREEVVQILYNRAIRPQQVYSAKFSDVPAGQWYTNAVLWANSENIVSGYENGKYGVGDNVTREQLAVMLYKYAQYRGESIYQQSGVLDSFSDKGTVQNWAVEAMQWAVTNGIMSGTIGQDGSTVLAPDNTATRAEAATMINKLLDM